MKKKSKGRLNRLRWQILTAKLKQAKPFCEYCIDKPSVDCHHIISKYYKKSLFRFDEKDIACLCKGCHFAIFHKDPVSTMRWFMNTRNEDYLYLIRKLEEYNA